MADITINTLTELAAAPASDDKIPIWDESASQYKYIVPANLIGATFTGAGTIATGGFTLTIPATGTAALLATAQTFSAKQTFTANIQTNQLSINTATALYLADILASAGAQLILRAGQSGIGNGLTVTSDGSSIKVAIDQATPQAALHVGAGNDTPVSSAPVIYASLNAATDIVVRNSLDNVEARLGVGASTANMGTATAHALLFLINNAAVGRWDANGHLCINTSLSGITSGVGLDSNGSTLRLRTPRTPASAGATGAIGEICWDTGFIYVCTATNTWERAAIATW